MEGDGAVRHILLVCGRGRRVTALEADCEVINLAESLDNSRLHIQAQRPLLARVLTSLLRYSRQGFANQKANDIIAEAATAGVDLTPLSGWMMSLEDMEILRGMQDAVAVIVSTMMAQHQSAIAMFCEKAMSLSSSQSGAALQRLAQWQYAHLCANPRRSRRLRLTPVMDEPENGISPCLRVDAFNRSYWKEFSARMHDKEQLRHRLPKAYFEYSPSAFMQSERTDCSSLSDFGRFEHVVTLYIDEVWPSGNECFGNDWVMFGGVLWAGNEPDSKDLPKLISSHTRGFPLYEWMQKLKKCPRARPFVIRVSTPQMEISARHYIEYLQYALAAAVGWLMPGDGWNSQLRLVMEAAGFAGFPPDFDDTARFKGYFDALAAICPQRYGRWRVREAVWKNKRAEYLGYADAIAYLALAQDSTEEIRNKLDVDNWIMRIDLPIGEFSSWLQGKG